MNEDRKRILKMLAEGKISAQEAEELIDALGQPAGPASDAGQSTKAKSPKYMYVKVTGNDTVDVRVPLGLLRAGMRLTSLIPKQAMDHINSSMHEKGISFDLNNIKPEDIDELIRNLSDMEVNVDSKNGDHVKVFCGE
jgi:DUF4097 and DUF4098 domain-containing protein YvlB